MPKVYFFSLLCCSKVWSSQVHNIAFYFLLLSVAPCKMKGPLQGNAMADPSLDRPSLISQHGVLHLEPEASKENNTMASFMGFKGQAAHPFLIKPVG